MIKINSALILYFTALLLFIISVLIDSDNLELFSKPIIIPSIYYFYYISVRGKINYLFSFSILSFFIGEILILISAEDYLLLSLIALIIPYFIVFYFMLQDLIYYLKKRKINLNVFSFYIFVMFLAYLLSNVLLMIFEENSLEFYIYVLYGVVLLFLGVLAFVMQINYTNKAILFAGLTIVCFIMSDLFFVFAKFSPDLMVLKAVNVITQELSFFCYVNYFIFRTKFNFYGKKNSQDE